MRTHSRFRAAGVAVLGCLAIAGCGSEPQASSVMDVIPEDAAAVIQGRLDLSDSQTAGINALASRVFGVDDVGELISAEFDEALVQAEPPGDFEEQIEPFLGDRVVTWMTAASLVSDDTDFAVLIEVGDHDAAEDFFELDKEEPGEYEGVEYHETPGGFRSALLNDLVVLGTPAAFEHAIDTFNGGPTLEDEALAEQLEGDAIATAYVDLPVVLDAVTRTPADEAAVETVKALAPELLERPLTASLDATENTAVIDASIGSVGPLAGAPQEAVTLGEVPADVIYSTGTADLGERYGHLFDLAAELDPQTAGEFERFDAAAEQVTGAPLSDTLGAIGDVSIFLSAPEEAPLAFGFLLEVADRATAEELLRGVEASARAGGLRTGPLPAVFGADAGFSAVVGDDAAGFSFPLAVALRDDRLVAGTASTVAATLDFAEPLGSTEQYSEAREELGELGMGGYADLPRFADAMRTFSEQSPWAGAAATYMERLGYLAYGIETDDETSDARIVLGFD